mmetsp:Transcript_31556/g.90510  ORF Transcript_31556/g.90510 Transcript_31556/m.90510 type:complete len:243 (-) Transcript_31556:360-1088(-)
MPHQRRTAMAGEVSAPAWAVAWAGARIPRLPAPAAPGARARPACRSLGAAPVRMPNAGSEWMVRVSLVTWPLIAELARSGRRGTRPTWPRPCQLLQSARHSGARPAALLNVGTQAVGCIMRNPAFWKSKENAELLSGSAAAMRSVPACLGLVPAWPVGWGMALPRPLLTHPWVQCLCLQAYLCLCRLPPCRQAQWRFFAQVARAPRHPRGQCCPRRPPRAPRPAPAPGSRRGRPPWASRRRR